MNRFRNIAQGFSVLMVLCVLAVASFAQSTTGNVRGTVTDPNEAVVPNAKVTLTQKTTNTSSTQQTTGSGEFQFNNLLVGEYSISIEAANFKKLNLNDVKIQLNQTTDVPAQLTVGLTGEVVEVTAGGAELVDTTSNNLSKSFSSRQVVELAQTSIGGTGVNNLSLLAANVSSSGGVGVGAGGSVGGQRPRNNNFVLDGVDNNDKSVTGPQSYISPEEVAEFTLLQNQFSSEYARSNGGQFLTVTKSGTNEFHGSAYGFIRNKYLNALDQRQIEAGVIREKIAGRGDDFFPRSDFFRGGANFSGPFPGIFQRTVNGEKPAFRSVSNNLFFFASYERLQSGSAASPGGIETPTALGRSRIAALTGVSNVNRSVLLDFLPTASTRSRDITINGVLIPVGNVSFAAPQFFKQNHAVGNVDYSQSSNTQHRFRFTMTNGADIDNGASLPIFYTSAPSKQRLFSYTLTHNFTSHLINETRLAFRRSSSALLVPNFTFPGLDAFPNIGLNDLGVDIGPNGNAPQSGIENNYQVVNNLIYLAGNHSFKFGGDFRKIISPQRFVQRERGDYQYLSTQSFLRDLVPVFGERNVGGNTYYGDQKIFYGFAQDDWRIRPNLTLNLGVSYSYQEIPKGAKFQAANAIASVPGLLEFKAPTTQTKNFAPKVGFAYSPNYDNGLLGKIFGSGGKSSLRAGFSMGYDYIFDNLYILSNPPQAQQTVDVGGDEEGTFGNFLATGGISPIPAGGLTDPAAARAATGSFIPDQKVPYSLTYTGSFQRQFLTNWSLELRYLGTRGVHLLTQNRLNVQAKVSPEAGLSGLPTYFSGVPTQAQIDALPASTLNLATIDARPSRVPRYGNAGFTSNVIGFLSNGNSTYHGASAQLNRRFTNGFQMTAAYTWSHLIDDTTAEVFSTVLSPRRVEDFQNLKRERANSALDHRHRFVSSILYELPFFRNAENGFVRTILGGINIAGTYTYESGEFVTIRSGNDSNRNGDSAGDRAILNPGGIEGRGSQVTALVRTCPSFDDDGNCTTSAASRTIGYRVNDPTARYVQAGNGVASNLARNTFESPSITNFDITVFKNFRFGEKKVIQFRADFFNAFNHPQYVPGSVNTVDPVSTTGVTQYNTLNPLDPGFLKADRIFSSNPRLIQLAARFNF
ncbi:MAG: carboxypeptidase regulatory-like domain-containing protein [Pyrinomonadaceae bacterium]